MRKLLVGALFASAMLQGRIQVHGHRGARAMRPENTIPAFQYAIATGADVLELDMAVTKDNVIVVSHDPVLHPPVCKGPADSAIIRQLTLEQVREWDCGAVRNPRFPKQQAIPGTRIPTLDEVFALASSGSIEFNIETKSFPDHSEFTPPPDEFARLVLDVIRKHKVERRVIVQSFDFRPLHAMKKIAPEIRLAALTENDKRDFAAIAAEAGTQIISPYYGLVTNEKVKQAHDAGLLVVPWTANDPATWDRLIDAGVDAIISDDPAALIEHLQRRGYR